MKNVRPSGTLKHPNWWIRNTSSWMLATSPSLDDREKARRSRLCSWLLLGVLIACVTLVVVVSDDPSSVIALVAVAISLLVALAFNAFGHVNVAGSILTVATLLAIFLSTIGYSLAIGGLDFQSINTFYLLAAPILVAGTLLPAAALWSVLGVSVVGAIMTYLTFPHLPVLALDEQRAYGASPVLDLAGEMGRQIAICIVVAAVVALYTSGVDKAIRATYEAQGAQALAESEQRVIEQLMTAFVTAIQHTFNKGQIVRLTPIPNLPPRWFFLYNHANNQLGRFEPLMQEIARGRLVMHAIDLLMDRLNRFKPGLQIDQLASPRTGSREVDNLAIAINKTLVSPGSPRPNAHPPAGVSAPVSPPPQFPTPWGGSEPPQPTQGGSSAPVSPDTPWPPQEWNHARIDLWNR